MKRVLTTGAVLVAAITSISFGSIYSSMTASEKDYPVTLTEQEKNHPLAKYYYQKIKLPEQHLKSLKFYQPQHALIFEKAYEILNPGYLELENGFTRFKDGTGYVAVNIKFPGASGTMLDWWFDWVGYEPIRYKIWYPGLHAKALYQVDREKDKKIFSITQAVLKKPEGKAKHTIEAIGKDTGLKDLYITFVDPDLFGLDKSKLGKDQWAFCAVVRSGPFEVARMIHFVRKTGDGAEMRSRFWLGEKLPWLARKLAVSDKQLFDMAHHCAVEYTPLASFLPEVYRKYGLNK